MRRAACSCNNHLITVAFGAFSKAENPGQGAYIYKNKGLNKDKAILKFIQEFNKFKEEGFDLEKFKKKSYLESI